MKWLARIALILFVAFTLTPAPPADATGVKVFVQWAKANPQDWVLTDTGTWSSLSTKLDPVGDVSLAGLGIGDSLLNQSPGWIFAVNVQGVNFDYYDHYAVEETAGVVKITGWRDDPILFPEGTKQADVGTFNQPTFDIKVGQTNTSQSFVIYAQPNNQWWSRGCNPCGGIVLKPYTDFVAPSVLITKPGIYVSDAKWAEHLAARTLHGWKEWTN
jgi:hypothetical protein